MTPSWNPDLLNRHIAPGIAEFTACSLPDISDQHPEAPHWIANHFLASIFRAGFTGKSRQLAHNLLFRAQTAFRLYHSARHITCEYLAQSKPHNPSFRMYYHAISEWESCFLNVQIFIDVFNRFNSEKAFQPDDASIEQRTYDIANAIKHWAGVIDRNGHEDDDTIPLWLSNEGFHSRRYFVTYAEFANVISDCAVVANALQDPRSLRDAAAAE